jgi:hypothetical protein
MAPTAYISPLWTAISKLLIFVSIVCVILMFFGSRRVAATAAKACYLSGMLPVI